MSMTTERTRIYTGFNGYGARLLFLENDYITDISLYDDNGVIATFDIDDIRKQLTNEHFDFGVVRRANKTNFTKKDSFYIRGSKNTWYNKYPLHLYLYINDKYGVSIGNKRIKRNTYDFDKTMGCQHKEYDITLNGIKFTNLTTDYEQVKTSYTNKVENFKEICKKYNADISKLDNNVIIELMKNINKIAYEIN